MNIYYYFSPLRPAKEKDMIRNIYNDLIFVDQKPWAIASDLHEEDFLICMSIDELADIIDLKDDIDTVINEYMNLYNRGVTLMFDKSTQCNSMFVQTLVSDTQDFETVLRKCIYNYIGQKEIELKYAKKHKVTADVKGTKLGVKKGSKITTKKSIEMKAKIRSLSKDFNGTLGDRELLNELNLSRNTYYKYKKAMKEGMK